MAVIYQVVKEGIDVSFMKVSYGFCNYILLQGIEVFNNSSSVEKYNAIADELGLLKSGGTDYHGYNMKSENAPGALLFPRANVEAFLAHAKSVWKPQLKKTLYEIQRQLVSGVKSSVSLLIWKDLEECARAAIKEFDLRVVVSESGYYRTLHIRISHQI